MPLGPCLICGETDYPLSLGGPGICPSCDCGNFGITVVKRQAAEIIRLRAELEELRKEVNNE